MQQEKKGGACVRWVLSGLSHTLFGTFEQMARPEISSLRSWQSVEAIS
jgi:hypothetical protein